MADIDAAFIQKVFDISQGQWKTDVHHYGKPDDLGRRPEIAERVGFCHPANVGDHPARLKPILSDKAMLVPTESPWLFNNCPLLMSIR